MTKLLHCWSHQSGGLLLRELSGRFYKLSLLGREVVEWWLVLGGGRRFGYHSEDGGCR